MNQPKTKHSSQKKVIFECQNNRRWAVCLSLKRNLIFYYNIGTDESFWKKPDSVVLTEYEQELLKPFEKVDEDTSNVQYKLNKPKLDQIPYVNKCKRNNDSNVNLKDSLINEYKKLKTELEKNYANLNFSIKGYNTEQNLENKNLSTSKSSPKYKIPFNNKSKIQQNNYDNVSGRLKRKTDDFNTFGQCNDGGNIVNSIKQEKKSDNLRNKNYMDQISSTETSNSFATYQNLPGKSEPLSKTYFPDTRPSHFSSAIPSTSFGTQQQTDMNTTKNKCFQPYDKTSGNKHFSSTFEKPQEKHMDRPFNNASQNFPETKRKTHRKKRQNKRLGYWYNKQKAASLMYAVFKESNNNDGSNEEKTTPEMEEMEWEESEKVESLQIIPSLKVIPKEKQSITENLLYNSLKPHLLIVIDTKILLYQKKMFLHFINGPPSEFPAAFVVPYMVLTELDRLKNKEECSYQKKLRDIADLLQKVLLERHPRVIGQRAEASINRMDENLDLTKVEDSIINCCLQYQLKGFYVVLFTHDFKLMMTANKLNIISGNKKKVYKEIGIFSVMKKIGFLDEMEDAGFIGNVDDEPKIKNKIPEYVYNMINNNLDSQLFNYFSSVLTKAMSEFYGEHLWRNRFLIKPPWAFHEICINLRHHWFVLTNKIINDTTKRHVNNIYRLLLNFNSVQWTYDVVGGLLDSIKHISRQLEKRFPLETWMFNKVFANYEAVLNEELNKHTFLIKTTSEALSEANNFVFYNIISNLKQKCEEACNCFDQVKTDAARFQLQEALEILLNSSSKILIGVKGMLNHQSAVINPSEPFVLHFMEGLITAIKFNNKMKPKSSDQNILESQITAESVINFFCMKQRSGNLPDLLIEIETCHTLLINMTSFVLQRKYECASSV